MSASDRRIDWDGLSLRLLFGAVTIVAMIFLIAPTIIVLITSLTGDDAARVRAAGLQASLAACADPRWAGACGLEPLPAPVASAAEPSAGAGLAPAFRTPATASCSCSQRERSDVSCFFPARVRR